MSKQFLKEVFSNLLSCQAWSVQLLQVKNSSKNGTTYLSREISLNPETKVEEYIRQLSESYVKDQGYIDSFSSVDDYTGDVVDHVVYKLDRANHLIQTECDSLINTVANPNREAQIDDIIPTALLFQGAIKTSQHDIGDTSVILISMQKPMTLLKNKFSWISGRTFEEITKPVLTLKSTIDVAIIGDIVYLFTLAGENLFGMERSYKAICKIQVDEIAECGFLSDVEIFKSAANQGRNPRRFVAYNPTHFEALKDETRRKSLADKFNIPIKDSIIVTEKLEDVEKLVKFLCNKAMLDPCDNSPMEVAGTKPWGK